MPEIECGIDKIGNFSEEDLIIHFHSQTGKRSLYFELSLLYQCATPKNYPGLSESSMQ